MMSGQCDGIPHVASVCPKFVRCKAACGEWVISQSPCIINAAAPIGWSLEIVMKSHLHFLVSWAKFLCIQSI